MSAKQFTIILRSICLSLPLMAVSLISCDSGAGSLGNGNGSVGDVTVPGGDSSGRPLPGNLALSARVRNESSAGVDVTMRFIHDDEVVHLAFVRVPTATITTVVSPKMADLVELSGVNDQGSALDRAAFEYGRDFDELRPAEYLVRDRGGPATPDDGVDGVLSLQLREPARDITVRLGATTLARWTDDADEEGALVRLYLRPSGSSLSSSLVGIAPAISASLDGLNDELAVLIQGVSPGRYALVGDLSNGQGDVVQSIAPGVLNIVADAGNIAPTIAIRSPLSTVDVEPGGSVSLSWTDSDPDHNATITFSLERPDAATAAVFPVGPPIAENPDGRNGDSARVSAAGVIPGIYDLVGTISDGSLMGTARVVRAVRVLPAAENEAPQLVLRKPGADVTVAAGGALVVGWEDSDANDDAQISILVDSEWNRVGLSGGESVLVGSISENDDGSGDEVTVRIPPDLTAGKYRVIGVITDGMTQVVTRAPGFVFITADPDVVIDPDDDGSDAGGDDPGDGDAGDGDAEDDGDDNDQDDDDAGDGDNGNDGDSDDGSENDGDDDGGADDGEDGGSAGDLPDKGDGSGGGSDEPDDNGGGNDRAVPSNPRAVEPSTFVVAWQARIPNTPRRLLATNVPYGGTTTIEMPTSLLRPSPPSTFTQIEVPVELVPNDAWPRSFDLIVEYEVRGTVESTRSEAPVWIPQLVEVIEFDALNYACSSRLPYWNSNTFMGVELVWYGGGVQEDDTGTMVEFWLTNDRAIPPQGIEDNDHRLLWRSTGSPNTAQTTRVDIATVLNGGSSVIATGEGEGSRLTPGPYHLVVVADYGRLGQVISSPMMAPIVICDQSLGSND